MTSFFPFELNYLLIGNPWSLLKLKVQFNLFSTQVPLPIRSFKSWLPPLCLSRASFVLFPSIPARDKDDVSFGEDWLTYSKFIGILIADSEVAPKGIGLVSCVPDRRQIQILSKPWRRSFRWAGHSTLVLSYIEQSLPQLHLFSKGKSKQSSPSMRWSCTMF